MEHYNYLYYVKNEPEITDQKFDELMHELERLEAEHPEMFDPNSPTQRVGNDTTNEFVQVAHKYGMMSLANTYSEQEIRDFDERVRKGIGGDDVEYVCEAGSWYLRVYIDKAGGVSIDDCEAVSRALDPILDEADPIPTSYVFEVSSAGAERALKRPGDFARFIGEQVEVKHYQPIMGAKSHVGTLVSRAEDGTVTIELNGQQVSFPAAQVAQVRLRMTI